MGKVKRKTITELRKSLFETFDEVLQGKVQFISHKNGTEIAMVPADMIEKLENEVELHKNLSIGYAQALREEGISSEELINHFRKREKNLRRKND